ncbi:hypothetical protein BV898_13551 [Hypsibius exemplaris]|uniref:Uncharacterized protein n=1 Tax=Hypsibius exemplaris TaxID=2072580 RepID=A0A1W0WAH3_HYPEX|nr:hypothetical protein BV898_13551 [Hypsibius exemplaris]
MFNRQPGRSPAFSEGLRTILMIYAQSGRFKFLPDGRPENPAGLQLVLKGIETVRSVTAFSPKVPQERANGPRESAMTVYLPDR